MSLALSLTLPPSAKAVTAASAAVGPDRNVVNAMSAPLSDTSFAVAFKLSGESSGTRLAVSTSSTMSSPTYFGPVDTSTATAKHVATGLSAYTKYFYEIEVNGSLKSAPSEGRRSCWTAPAKTGYGSFVIGYGSCGGVAGAAEKSTVIEGMLGLASPPRVFLHLGDFVYYNGFGTTTANYEHIYDDGFYENGSGSRALGLACRTIGVVYIADDHDNILNNSCRDIAQDPDGSSGVTAVTYRQVPVSWWQTVSEVHRRRNPIPVSYRMGTTYGSTSWSEGRNNSFAIPYGPFLYIAIDTRSQKVWQVDVTFSAAYTAQTHVTVTCDFGGTSTGAKRPWIGYQFIGQTGITDGTKIIGWDSAQPPGTGVLSYDIELDTPITVASGATASTKSQQIGAEQLQYVKDKIDYAVANDYDIILGWPNGLEWLGWQDNPDYNMLGMRAEIKALYDYIELSGWSGRTIALGGDMHSSQWESGLNHDQGNYGRQRIPSFRTGALFSTTTTENTVADFNLFNAISSPTKTSCGGVITVTDNGDGTRTYKVDGYHVTGNTSGTLTDFAMFATSSVTLPQAAVNPFNNGVSIIQTYKTIWPRLTALNVTMRQAPANGNLLVCVVSQRTGSTTTGSLNAGWVALTAVGATGVFTHIFYKRCGAGESTTQGPGVSFSGSTLDTHFIELNSDTGWHATDLIHATASDPYAGSTRTSVTCNLTTTQPNCAVIVAAVMDNANGHTQGETLTGFSAIMKTPLPSRPQTLVGGANMSAAATLTITRTTVTAYIANLATVAFRKA